jgi:hypothetical protein
MINQLAAYLLNVLNLDLVRASVIASIVSFKIVCSDRAFLRKLLLIHSQRTGISRRTSLLSWFIPRWYTPYACRLWHFLMINNFIGPVQLGTFCSLNERNSANTKRLLFIMFFIVDALLSFSLLSLVHSASCHHSWNKVGQLLCVSKVIYI